MNIKIVALILIFPLMLIASNSTKYFNNKEYKKAFELLQNEANDGSKPAMYRLAHMYENGLGVEKSEKNALLWFKKAASSYEYTLAMDSDEEHEKKEFTQKLHEQMNSSVTKESKANSVEMMEQKTPETKDLAQYFLGDSYFGLEPYHANYLLPIAYSSHKYPRYLSAIHRNNYQGHIQDGFDSYHNNVEVEFQISLQKALTYNLFGWDENINIVYTQKAWWSLYDKSAPFRELNFSPELFMSVPSSDEMKDSFGLQYMKYAYLHESNGQDGYSSRSWNRLYVSGQFQFKNLFISPRVWYRFHEDKKYDGYYQGLVNPKTGNYDPNDEGDDNPNIENYLGYGDIKINYLYGKSEFGALLRYNFGSGGKNRGAVDLHWSYPLLNSQNTFFYLKFFNGYGESLIDYDNCVTKTAFGISFSRGIF